MGLTARVLASILRRGMLRGGETVLVAVSGGADSVALLHVLRDLAPRLGLTLHAGHVHHGLRVEADQDAELVAGHCRQLGIAVHLERVCIDRARRTDGDEPWAGLEAEARRVRYRAFRRLAAVAGAGWVATAHTADDQAETVLMRLAQGAGPRGLAGIPPVRGPFIRPLIEVRRAEIEADLRRRGVVWADDAMNRDPRFLRTRIRHEILPLLEAHFQPSARPSLVARLCRSADLVRAAVADLERRAAEVLDGAARSTAAGVVLPLAALAPVSPGLAAEVVRLAAVRGGAASGLRGPSHRAIARAIDPAVTASRAGLGRLVVERSGSWLRVGPRRLAPLGEHAWPVPGSLDLAERGICLEARVLSRFPGYTPPCGTRAVAFDAARMPSALVVRARRAGDRFAPFGAPGSRRLKALLIAAGVPRWERDRLPLVVAGDDIAWVVGLRRGRVAPVTAETSRILELTVHGPVAGESPPE